jgi:hypothetical protein
MYKKILITIAIIVFGWLIVDTLRHTIADYLTSKLIEVGITDPTTQAYSIIGISFMALILIFYFTNKKFDLFSILKK